MNISLGKDSITEIEFFIDSSKHLNLSGMSGTANACVEWIRLGCGAPIIDRCGDAAAVELGNEPLCIAFKRAIENIRGTNPACSLVNEQPAQTTKNSQIECSGYSENYILRAWLRSPPKSGLRSFCWRFLLTLLQPLAVIRHARGLNIVGSVSLVR
jgi:hypothetical protein